MVLIELCFAVLENTVKVAFRLMKMGSRECLRGWGVYPCSCAVLDCYQILYLQGRQGGP